MAEVDYGYGDQDYGYGDTSPDMEYGDVSPDMGYGDASPDTEGKAGEEAASTRALQRLPTKRRCSVTKFSLATDTPLTAASVIADLRNGISPDTPPVHDFQKVGGNADFVESAGSMEFAETSSESTETERVAPERKGSGVLRFFKRR